jgi:hypothetical protein
MNIIAVRLETISYGVWENLEVAIDVESQTGLYLTYPTVQLILNYDAKSWSEKAKSKTLEIFLGKPLVNVTKTGSIVNKKIDRTPRIDLMSLGDFIAIAIWESSVNRNTEVTQILASGFGDSIRSTAYKQLGTPLGLKERQR